MKAEQEELTARIKANEVTVYSAIGTLRTSSLQQGSGILYRLTDPGNGRTLVYIRSADPKQLNAHLGQLIGVKGEIGQDALLKAKAITPSSIERVEASKINNGVTAQVLPPSLTLQRQITQAGN